MRGLGGCYIRPRENAEEEEEEEIDVWRMK
jgi:hypothetical protein